MIFYTGFLIRVFADARGTRNQMECHDRLLQIAELHCIPYLQSLPRFRSMDEKLIFLLVGSVAHGLCNEHSDIDIAVVCDEPTYAEISIETEWSKGRPTEVVIAGTQLHFYGLTLNEIRKRIEALDDHAIFNYLGARVMQDPCGRYAEMLGMIDTSELHDRRIHHAATLLLRRLSVFDKELPSYDPLVMASISVELITLLVKTIAVLDATSFDPRKRPVATGLRGALGQHLKLDVLGLFPAIAELGQSEPNEPWSFPNRLRQIVKRLPLPKTE